MNDLLTRRYPMTVKPLHRETEASYTRRLLTANRELDSHQKQLLRAAKAETATLAWQDVLELKTGRHLRFGAQLSTAELNGGEHRCELCPDAGTVRRMCTLCAKGETVLQAPDFTSPVCIRHRRWIGLDLATRQSTVDVITVRAALRFNRLQKSGRLTPHLYNVLRNATARIGNGDVADLTVIVDIAAAVTTGRFLEQLLRPGTDYAHAYAVLAKAVTGPAGRNATTVIAALWGYFRPTFWALRHAVVTATPYELAWEHDHAVPQHLADAYITAHQVIPFASYNAQDKRSSSFRIGRGGFVICDHGHQHSSKGRCPVCTNSAVAPGYNDLATTHPDIAKELRPSSQRDHHRRQHPSRGPAQPRVAVPAQPTRLLGNRIQPDPGRHELRHLQQPHHRPRHQRPHHHPPPPRSRTRPGLRSRSPGDQDVRRQRRQARMDLPRLRTPLQDVPLQPQPRLRLRTLPPRSAPKHAHEPRRHAP
ncbi:hypothetical protein P9139_06270 [Curtobacterium flaccumfaciens]|nr:hypothetical protein P9139_06270 [Curtobacterium flaccumfaciens]